MSIIITMEAITFPKSTTPLNPSPFPTKSLTFPASHLRIAKTLYPFTFLALSSRKPHTDTHNVEFSINPNNENEPQEMQYKPGSENPLSEGLIFDLGQFESWDCVEIGSPVVKRFLSDDEERWLMWYYGRSEKDSNTGSVGLAVSSNGVHWERGEQAPDSSSGTGKVMNCNEDWWAFDTKCIRPSEIMIMSSIKVRVSSAVYWMYYTGLGSEELEIDEIPQDFSFQLNEFSIGKRVFKALSGLAISQDGRNWARIEGDHHSGALFDVGFKGEWDSLFIASPHVVFHGNGDLRMYYHSFDPQEWRFRIGIARSRDGIKWVKLGKIKSVGQGSGSGGDWCFDEMGVLNACVVRDERVGNYVMAYEGVGRDGKRGIGIAISEDGLKDWRPVSDKAVLAASREDGWDSKGVGDPCLLQMDEEEDQWRLYYTGFGVDGRTGIGLAVSQGRELNSFRRWKGFTYG